MSCASSLIILKMCSIFLSVKHCLKQPLKTLFHDTSVLFCYSSTFKVRTRSDILQAVSQCQEHEGEAESKLHAVFSHLQVITLPFSLVPTTFLLLLSTSSSSLSIFRACERNLSPHPAVSFDTCLMYASLFFSQKLGAHGRPINHSAEPLSVAKSQSQAPWCN